MNWQHDGAQALGLDPVLQFDHFTLQVLQFGLIRLARELARLLLAVPVVFLCPACVLVDWVAVAGVNTTLAS